MPYSELQSLMSRISNVGSAAAVLAWDQETYMPDGAVDARSEQLATLSSLTHSFATSDNALRVSSEIPSYYDALSPLQKRVADRFVEDQRRAVKLPTDFVEQLARVKTKAQDAWKKARAVSDYSIFKPFLHEIVDLKQKEAGFVQVGGNPYDALLGDYEPGLSVESLTPTFNVLKDGTAEILRNIQPNQGKVSDEVLLRHYKGETQLSVAKSIIQTLGFDSHTGRIDISTHPFCTSFSHTDVRLTTRIREQDLRSCLFGLIHEAGHGMYEQGVSPELERTSAARGASMGIHESQSLFWENTIARSEEFWSWAFPILNSAFPTQLAGFNSREFYKSINRMSPSLNRVESDELTYNLHIILRYELENELINGIVSVDQVPEIWNERMKNYLGVVPPNDAEGCLQDVHWSFGGIGYFPSYSLGKLFAAMQWNTLKSEMPNVQNDIANGNFGNILNWQRKHIHAVGRSEKPGEIVERVCGKPLTSADFLDYISVKATDVYS